MVWASAWMWPAPVADQLHDPRTMLSDLRASGGSVCERLSAPRQDTVWYYRRLVSTYRRRPLPERVAHLVDELDRTVTELERWPDG